MTYPSQQPIKPVHNPVFTTATSLEDVLIQASQELEGGHMTPNRLRILFGVYHNTLLNKLEKGSQP